MTYKFINICINENEKEIARLHLRFPDSECCGLGYGVLFLISSQVFHLH